MKIIKLLLSISIIILTSCSTQYAPVDLVKLNSSQQKYGIIMMRSMFFQNQKLAQKFV
jgi:hypothetical protein